MRKEINIGLDLPVDTMPAWFRVQGLNTYTAIADYIITLQDENKQLRKDLIDMKGAK